MSGNIHDIRHHIRAVAETRKITSAMHLISSARMKKVLASVEYNRLYTSHIEAAMNDILSSVPTYELPYLHARGGMEKTFIVITGDKGMVGSYNADVLRVAKEHIKPGASHLLTIGSEAAKEFRRIGMQPDIEFGAASRDPSLESARHIMQDIFRFYDEGFLDEVYVVYTRFINSATRKVEVERLLPLDVDRFEDLPKKEDMIYHPSMKELFHRMVPQYFLGRIYGMLMNAFASEQGARIMAMQEATRNADLLILSLKSDYNMARQNAITQEIAEVSGAALAQRRREIMHGLSK